MVPILFTILLAGILGTQDAFAVTKTYVGGDNTDWEDANNWNPPGVPKKNDNIEIKAVPDTGALRVNINSDVTIGPSGSITSYNGAQLRVNDPAALLTIQGNYIMNNFKDDLFAREGTIVNDVTGSITLGLAQIIVQGTGTGGVFINHGTITGSLTGTPSVGEELGNNDFNIVIQSGGFFSNSGTCASSIRVLTGGTSEGISCVSGNNNSNPTQETEFVIDEIDTVIDPYGGTPVEEKLLDALDKLDSALEELEKPIPDYEAAIGNMEGAVGEIEAAVNEAMNLAEATEIMDNLAEIARQMAESAINLAISDPNSLQDKITTAQEYVAEGDALRASGDFKAAVNKYKGALSDAKGALN